MEILDIIHYPKGDPFDYNPEVFIAASGYESRSTLLPRKLEGISCRKIVFGFKEYSTELMRPENDSYFHSHGYEFYTASGNEDPNFEKIFQEISIGGLKVMVDISVMTRKWYHSLLRTIVNLRDYREMIVRIVYCPAFYSKSIKLRKSISINRLWMEEKIREESRSVKPKALIMGLGIEKGVSQNIHDALKPEKTVLFYADPLNQKAYVEDIYINNHKLINQIDIKDLLGYSIRDTSYIYKLLVDTLLPLRRDYQIIMVPTGPKIFTLIAMILQLSYPDLELAFPDFKVRQIKDRKPFSQYTFLDLVFGHE